MNTWTNIKLHLFRILFIGFPSIFLSCNQEQLFVVKDLTAEHIFSENIEGPVWRDSCWFVVNINKDGTIASVYENGKTELVLTLPLGSNANAIQFNSKGQMLLADWPMNQILQVEWPSSTVDTLVHDTLFYQPNDLTINQRDQVFASDPDWKNGRGRIWRIEPNGKATILKDSLGTTNGITLDPTQTKLYVNESVQRRIWVFQIDETGALIEQKLFTEFSDFGLDGMKCDREGNLFVTRHGKGTVVIFSPEGKVIREISLKGKKPSNIAFGGKDGRTCIVTLQDRGSIEFFRVEIPGAGF